MRAYTAVAGEWNDVGPDSLRTIDAADSWVWLDVDASDEPSVRAVAEWLQLPETAVADVLEPTEFPKLNEYGDAAFIVSHSPGLADDRFTTFELDSWVSGNHLITFHREPIPAIEWAMARDMRGYEGPAAVMAEILGGGAHRYLALVDALDTQIEELEGLAIAGDADVLGRVQALRRDAIKLRSLLAPERDTVRALRRNPLVRSVEVGRYFEAIYDDFFRVVESLDAARALLGAVLDTYRGTVAERANEVMKVLTVFSAIFLPLALLAGIYGMNFANMPELAWRWGYLILIGVMAAVGVGLWSYFAWRGFIGGPKLWRVDRAIGRGLGGLVHLTTAPLRGAAGLLSGLGDEDD